MTYVPDYVRPMGPKTLMPVPAIPTSNDQNYRKLSSAIPGPKASSSPITKAGRSQSDTQPAEDRIATRRTASNPTNVLNRSGKTTQDKICSRLSIKDRLKSLESEASVKLEIRPIAQRPKRRSLSRGSTRSRLSNSEKDHQSEDTSSISSISSVRTTGDFTEKFPENALMPKPDIISSNQPRSINSSGISTPDRRLDDASVSSSDQVEILKESFQRLALALEKSSDNAIAEVKLPHVSEQIDLTKRDDVPSVVTAPRKDCMNDFQKAPNHGYNPESDELKTKQNETIKYLNKDNDYIIEQEVIPERIPVTPSAALRKNSCDISSGSSTEVEEMADNNAYSNQEIIANDNSKDKFKAANGSVFKPVWRTPSTKQQQNPVLLEKLEDRKETRNDAESQEHTSSNIEENEDATPTLERKQNLVVSTRDKPVSHEKEGSVSFKETSADEVNITTTTQSSPNTTAVVELRSPRHEHNAQGLRRPGARDKRNARVFLVPSSSDSDMDNANQHSRMERDLAKLGLSRDLMPRSPSKHTTDSIITPELPRKPANATEKFIPDVLKPSPKDTRTERKTSNQSVDIYPELSTKSQRKEPKSHDGDLKKDQQKSPNRRRKSTRSGRAPSSRSKSTDSRKTSKDVIRHRSNSMCDPKRMRSGQETVANAVIYGTGAAIPYIDDVTSPTDESPINAEKTVSQKTPIHENNRGSIHRSNSADMLSSLAVDVPTPQFRRQRASSVDRSSSKAYNRRSYQIAMNLEKDPARLQNLNKNFHLHPDNAEEVNTSPNAVSSSKRSGILHFKVATIDKGKRTSSQKSWKQVWAMLKDHNLCLSKDGGKSKSLDSPLERQQSLQEEYQVLNIQSSLVGIAYNYLKRRNVFKAESRNDMLAWITAIQARSATWNDGTEGINEDLILKKTNQIDPGNLSTLMPFHDYSSALLRTKSKDQQLRHSSPAAYGRTNETKGKGLKNNNNEVQVTDLLPREDLSKSGKTTKKEKLKNPKRIPFRSNSNPTYFEDWSKSPETSRKKKSPLFNRRQSSGSSSVNSTTSKSSPLLKRSVTANSCTSIPSAAPSIVIDKPPVPSSNGSPHTGVRLRSKPSGSPKGGRRRQGFVLDANTTISSPVLISHEILPGDSKIKLRDIEQQGEVLTILQTPPTDEKQKRDKAVEAATGVGSRMAERIQRTIRALYTSNSSSPKKSYSPMRDRLVTEDSDFSDGSYSPELRGKALAGPQYEHLNEGSPKADKKNARKRSPKPSHKNNLQVKDVDGSRRFKWRGSVNKIVKKFGTGQPFALNSTFGVHLEDCPPSPTNEICCRIVEERGLDFTGIYRVPGNSAALNALQDDLNNHGVDSIRLDDERFKDLNVMSSLLKSFFRKLPEPLFTNELYHDFIKANRQPTAQNRLNSLRELVHMLPGPHYETLKFLITHLRLVADHCETNKMEVRNLAIVFGPTLVRNTAADNTATMVTDMSDQCRIIESIIDHSEWFFSDNMDDVPDLPDVALPPEREHEAVPSIEFLLENVGRKPGDAGTSDSAKSKGSDDSENSFSRDLMEMIFGKKWKQGGNPQAAVEEDDGGFGEYRSRKVEENPTRKQQYEKPPSIVNTSTDSPRISEGHGSPLQQAVIPNVSERLMDFYREQVERLSQTAIGQTLPAFSSADSSPRTTPRHSTVFNSPLVFPPQGDSRSRVNSDSQDPRHNIAASYEMQPTAYTHQIMADGSHSVSVPYYKHPPNPYQYSQQLYQPNQYQKYPTSFYAYNNEHNSSNTQKMPPKVQVKSHSHEDGINHIPKPKPRKHSTGSYRTDEYIKQSPQVEPNVALREAAVDVSMNENSPPASQNERLVGELPHVAAVTTKGPSVSRKSSQSGSTSQPAGKVKGHYKKSSITSFDTLMNQPQHKRIKTPLTENVSVIQAPTTATSDRLFSRYDPKRRGIRFGGTENDASVSAAPKKTQLTATERLFNGQQQQQQQQLRRRPSARENRRQRVTRRHTLSGLQDLQEHSPTLRFKSSMRRGAAGQNLSLHDLTSAAGNMQQSAMERLNPKGANSGMTMKNWIVQERLRNKVTIKKSDSVGRASMRRKDIEKGSRGVSYV